MMSVQGSERTPTYAQTSPSEQGKHHLAASTLSLSDFELRYTTVFLPICLSVDI